MSFADTTQFINFMNMFVPNKKWAVGGSFAIDMWCAHLGIQLSDTMPNNIDILYSAMTPITNKSIGPYERKQSCPHTSMTFQNPGFTPINLTMTRNNIKYYEVEGVKLMSPQSLLAWYDDEPEMHQEKINILNIIISQTENFQFNYLYSKEPLRLDYNGSPSKRRLLNLLV